MRPTAFHSEAADTLSDVNEDNGLMEDRLPSKSQLKREATALQELGRQLLELSKERLQKISMSEKLREALLHGQRLSKNEARRRQLQYIGKLMRSEDTAPIRLALDTLAGTSAAATAHLHQLERWRDELLTNEAATLNALTAKYPACDHSQLQQLRQLRRNALKEREQAKPPRAYREIFQLLKSLSATDSAPTLSFANEEDYT